MKKKASVGVMGILIDVVDPLRVEGARPADKSMDLIALRQ
jgi:hypothetical protein